MKAILLTSLALATLATGAFAHDHSSHAKVSVPAAAPVGPTVTSVTWQQSARPAGGSQVVVRYNLASPNGNCHVTLLASSNGGATWDIVPASVEGDVGNNVSPGTLRQITWNVSADLPNESLPQAAFRVLADDGVCTDCKLWSDPATWAPAGVPVAGDTVTIPDDWHVVLDVNTAPLAGLTVEGTLEFADQDLELTSDYIMVHDGGTFQIGSEAKPFTHRATVTLTATNQAQSIMGMGTRGLMVMGGNLELHGTAPAVAWTKISDHVAAGQTSLPLVDSVAWNAGDQIVIAPTNYHTVNATAQLGITERLTLTAGAGNAVDVAAGPTIARWGKLQYATAAGMSLTPDPGFVLPPSQDLTPRVLDERAEVGNLTRNIVIQAPNDAAWADGFGAHVMVMGADSVAHVDGVEIRRGGQRRRLGRYPYHVHLQSYDPPAVLADVTGQYIRNSTINESANRGIVVHGTNGLLVQNNIVYNVRGHGIFTEDAVEQRNTFDRNLVLRVRNPAGTQVGNTDALKLHEMEQGSPILNGGSSGFWISNPANTITGNVAADCEGFGFWLAFTFQAWGASTGVPMNPQRISLDEFSDNTAHSTRFQGLMIDQVEADPDGLVVSRQYVPAIVPPSGINNGVWADYSAAYAQRVPFELTRFTVWKAGHNGIWDRASGPRNRQVVSADNCQKFFSGSGEEGLIEHCLVVGTSLNGPPAGGRPVQGGDPTPSGFATYHSEFSIENNLAINFPLTAGQTSGVFAEDDFYFRPVEKGTLRNGGNVVVNSHPGFKSVALSSGTGGYQPFASWHNLAPAKWDPHGYWGGNPGDYVVYNSPFMTAGQTVVPVAPDAASSGAVLAQGPFYGFLSFVLHGVGDTPPQNQDYNDLMEIYVRRLGNDLNELGTWRVGGATPAANLAHMRSFAAHPSSIYELNFPFEPNNPGYASGLQHPTNFRMEVEGMLTTDDTLLIGVHFDGAINPQVRLSSPGNAFVWYTPVATFNDVKNSAGGQYFRDAANNRVWVKLRGGTWTPGNWVEWVTTPDHLLYETTYLYIQPAG